MSHSSVYGQINIKKNRYSERKKGKFALYHMNFPEENSQNDGRSHIIGILTFLLMNKTKNYFYKNSLKAHKRIIF